MGDAYSRTILGIPRPRVGVVSIGEEESKGGDLTRDTCDLFRRTGLNFVGNVEGRDFFAGKADVFVCDGFVGNVAIKTMEGMATALGQFLKEEIRKCFMAKVGALLMERALRGVKDRLDYEEYGGAPLLGVRGGVFICHGSSSERAIKNGIRAAGSLARCGVTPRSPFHRGRGHAAVNAPRNRKAITREERVGIEIVGLGTRPAERVDQCRLGKEWTRTTRGSPSAPGSGPPHPERGRRTRPLPRGGPMALDDAGVDPAELDIVVVGTLTPDMPFPSTACFLQAKIGATRAYGMDLSAACSGFVYSLSVTDALIRAGRGKKALVVGAEILSTVVDYTDRSTCILFGDGAGAAVLTECPEGEGVLSCHLHSDGNLWKMIQCPGGGTVHPYSPEMVEQRLGFHPDGGERDFKHAVLKIGRGRRRGARPERGLHRRRETVHPAPGEHPHHPGRREAARDPGRARFRQSRALREHLRRLHPDRARGSQGAGAVRRRGSRARRRLRGGAHLGLRPDADVGGRGWGSGSSFRAGVAVPRMGKIFTTRIPSPSGPSRRVRALSQDMAALCFLGSERSSG